MPYVHRSTTGEIQSLHRAPSRDAADFVRVLEDVIDALLGNGALQVTDLPPAAQAKLVIRKDWREQSGGQPTANGFAASAFVEVIDDSAFGDPGKLEAAAE